MEPLTPNYQAGTPAALPPGNNPLLNLRQRKIAVGVLYALLLSFTSTLYLMFVEQTADSVVPLYVIAISVFLFLWCKYDATQNGKRLDWFTGALIIVTGFLGVAVYFGRVRRWTFGECASIYFMLALAVTVLYYAGGFAINYLYYLSTR